MVRLPDGKPAVDAVVRPVGFLAPLTNYQLSESSVSDLAIHPWSRFRTLGFPESGVPWAVRTDENGRFTLEKVPSNSRVAVAIELAGHQTQAVWVKKPDDDNLHLYPQFELKSDGFETSLNRSFVLNLSGRNEASGNPEKISRILVPSKSVRPIDVSLSNGNVYVIDCEPAVDVSTSLLSTPDGFDIWVEPEDDALMGYRFKIDQIGTEGSLDKTIPFRPGKRLKGKVTNAADGKPIPGANLEWIGPDRNKFTVDGDFPKFDVQTEEDGNYVIAVPEGEGTLAIMGGVDGFRTVDSWTWVDDPQTGDATKEFLREISTEVLDAGGPVDFELEPASEVRFHVVRPNGQPERDAIIAANAFRATNSAESPYHARRRETLTTQSDGNATLANWYSHAGWLARARSYLDVPSGPSKQLMLEKLNSAGYPTTVEAFSLGGMLQGSAVIPLPKSGIRDPIDVEIKLLESATILGKVIDQNGQPMKDLKVSLARSINSLQYGSQVWETRTRDDGYFLATGLLPGNDYLILLGNRDVKPLRARFDRLLLEIKGRLVPGKTTEIETIECFDCRFLGEPLPELNIEGLEQPEAFEVIAKYVHQQLVKIPEEHPKFPSSNTADPIPVFLEKLATVLIPKLREAGDLNPGSQVELERLTEIGSLFLPPALSLNFMGEQQVRDVVNERLLVHFNNHPNAQPTLLAIAEMRADSPENWKNLFARSTYESTKQKAGIEAAFGFANDVGTFAITRFSADQFQAKFRILESHLNELEKLSWPKSSEEVKSLRTRVDALRESYQNWYDLNEKHKSKLPEGYQYDPARLQMLYDRMDRFVDQVVN